MLFMLKPAPSSLISLPLFGLSPLRVHVASTTPHRLLLQYSDNRNFIHFTIKLDYERGEEQALHPVLTNCQSRPGRQRPACIVATLSSQLHG